MFTPENVEYLGPNEVFVFGSNLLGQHGGGAAHLAFKKFGAKWGRSGAEGLHGQSYAFPTLNINMNKQSQEVLEASRDRLFECAKENKDLVFFVTKLGCGIAGFSEEEIKPLFGKNTPKNIILPKGWDVRYA